MVDWDIIKEEAAGHLGTAIGVGVFNNAEDFLSEQFDMEFAPEAIGFAVGYGGSYWTNANNLGPRGPMRTGGLSAARGVGGASLAQATADLRTQSGAEADEVITVDARASGSSGGSGQTGSATAEELQEVGAQRDFSLDV